MFGGKDPSTMLKKSIFQKLKVLQFILLVTSARRRYLCKAYNHLKPTYSLVITLLLVIFSIKSHELSVDKLKELSSRNVLRNQCYSWVEVLLIPFLDYDSLRYSMRHSIPEDCSKEKRLSSFILKPILVSFECS
jgi:hypothetical protein